MHSGPSEGGGGWALAAAFAAGVGSTLPSSDKMGRGGGGKGDTALGGMSMVASARNDSNKVVGINH